MLLPSVPSNWLVLGLHFLPPQTSNPAIPEKQPLGCIISPDLLTAGTAPIDAPFADNRCALLDDCVNDNIADGDEVDSEIAGTEEPDTPSVLM